jgi:hypothetical protein
MSTAIAAQPLPNIWPLAADVAMKWPQKYARFDWPKCQRARFTCKRVTLVTTPAGCEHEFVGTSQLFPGNPIAYSGLLSHSIVL